MRSIFAVVFVFSLFFVGATVTQAAELMPPCESCSFSFSCSDYSQGQWGNFATDGNAFYSAGGGVQRQSLWGTPETSGEVFQSQGSSQNFDIPGGAAWQSSGSFIRTHLGSGDPTDGN